VLLRKALCDDDKARRYITTVPKIGYRFIADVKLLDPSAAPSPTPHESPARLSPRWGLWSLGVGALAVAVLLLKPSAQPLPQSAPSIVPLSRLATTQTNADLASDGKALLFTADDGGRNAIYMILAPGAEPLPVSAPDGNADFAKWAPDDSFLIYQYRDASRCEFHRIARTALMSRVPEVIYECRVNSFTELSLSPDGNTLYFVERATNTAPYGVYALDLEKKTKRRLSQPVASGYGNHYVDVHPQSGALLLLSDHRPGKTSVYEIDPVRGSFARRSVFEYSLDSAIWSHREGYVVHPSRHPSYQLLETSLATGESNVLVSDSRRISGPRRIRGAGGDYLFTSYLYNRDIEMAAFPAARFNSAVMDYLPAISHDRHQLAFVSKRSGDSQIWLRDFRDGRLRAIEPPEKGRRFLDLRWSLTDDRLLANTNTGILVYSLVDEAFVHDIALPLPAHAVHWYDAQTLSFSHYEGERWQAYLYELETGTAVPLDQRWAFSVRNAQQQLFLDQSLMPVRNDVQLTALRACAYPLWRAQLRYQLDGENIYCHARDAPADLLRFDAAMNAMRLEDVVERYEFFSVRDGQIAKTKVMTAYSDIMRTRRPN